MSATTTQLPSSG